MLEYHWEIHLRVKHYRKLKDKNNVKFESLVHLCMKKLYKLKFIKVARDGEYSDYKDDKNLTHF